MALNSAQGNTDVQTLARLLNITPRRVQQLATEGVIPTAGRGTYPLEQCIQAYVRFLQEKLNGSGDARGLSEERAALARSQREHTDLRVRKLRGELVPADAAVRVLQALAAAMKGRLEGMPFLLRQRFPQVPADAVAELQELIDDALRQVATDGLPAEYRAALRPGNADPAPDGAADPERVG